MITTAVLVLSMSGQIRVGNTADFQGFLSEKKVAIEVAATILKSVMGQKWLNLAEPLKAELFLGRWIVTGSYDGAKEKGPDLVVEPYVIALDKWSGRVAAFGAVHNTNVKEILTKLPPDGPKTSEKTQ